MRISVFVAAWLSFGMLTPMSAFAYDDNGHQIIAYIADHYLSSEARKKVTAILAADADKLAAHDIAGAATWADKYAASDKAGGQTADWHYAAITANRPNIPRACDGQKSLPAGTPASRGPAKACVVDKVEQFAQELADPTTPEAEKRIALKFLLNLVGDVHQPLRVADEGNSFGKSAGIAAKSMTPGDLFTLWDSIVISRLVFTSTPYDVARLLISRISAEDQKLWASRTPQLWALEAHQLGVDYAYGMTGNYDDQGNSIIEESQIDKATRITAIQLSRAGVRLAYVLNEALAPAELSVESPVVTSSGNADAGAAFARVVCSVCHVTSKNQSMETTAPDFSAIANTNGVTENALREFLSGPHPTMPNMHLSEKQTNNAIAYILSLKSKK